MTISYDFTDTQGKWTNEKRHRCHRELRERCASVGYYGDIAVECPDPVALAIPANGPVPFRYSAYVELPDED